MPLCCRCAFTNKNDLCIALHHVINEHLRNGDGIDVDSCSQVLVENSYIDVEDDSLCIKSGMDAIGRNYGRPTRDVIFRNNSLGRGGGLTIGSEGSGGVYNVSYENLTLNGTSVAVHIKSRPSRGGVYDGIVFKDIIAHNVYSLFSVNMGGECISQANGFCSNDTRPQLNNVLVQDVRCDSTHYKSRNLMTKMSHFCMYVGSQPMPT